MAFQSERKDFTEDVYPAELEEIRRRRYEAGDQRVSLEDGQTKGPSTDHGMLGLAFSGGGIRSASFSLGVAQYLIKNSLFKYFDYLSTVSGGGYTGSCISALMSSKHGERLLVQRKGAEEPLALNHLRNNSNFLVPGGLFNNIRMPSLFMIGVLQNLLLFLPVVVLSVFLAEVFFEGAEWLSLPIPSFTLAVLGVAPLIAAVFVRPLFQSRRRNWKQRDRADQRAGVCLVLAVVSLISMPLLGGLEFLVENDVTAVLESTGHWFQLHLQRGIRSLLIWSIAIAVVALLTALYRFRSSVLLWICGALGPTLLLIAYMACCVYVINSPHVNPSLSANYRAALENYVVTEDRSSLQQAVEAILVRKHFRPDHYRIDFDTVNQFSPSDTALKILRHPDAKQAWWHRFPVLRSLTTRQTDRLTIQPDPIRKDEIWIPELSLLRFQTEWFVYLAGLLLWVFNFLFVNVNRTSLHPFYRDRLSRTFLISGGDNGIESADSLRLSELGIAENGAPYQLINTALNLHGSRDPQLRQRKTVPFMLSKRFCGSEHTGYCETQKIEQIDRNMDLGTAMAISAAAAGPLMGAKTVRSLSFFLALLNVRLAYWLPHPGRVDQSSWLDWFIHRNPGLLSLLSEACGIVSDRGRFVNCSDGGHIENLGVYELLRRRCKTIICVDGSADPRFGFFDLTTLQRYASIDLGAKIDIDVTELLPNENGISKQHYAVGTVTYHGGQEGTLIYLKLSYSGDESEYLRFYKREVSAFPHEPTSDQFFDETKFEVYRALGYHVAETVFDDPGIRNRVVSSDCQSPETVTTHLDRSCNLDTV